MSDRTTNDLDDLDNDDIMSIEESEAQIARGEVSDWEGASAQVRKKYLEE